MKGLQRKCLLGSVLFHGLLLALVVVGSAFIPKNTPSPTPVFEVFDLQATLVDQPNVVSGGRKSKSWVYLPAPGDESTMTTLSMSNGQVSAVQRKVMR